MKLPLFGTTLPQLEEIAESMGLPPFTARQIANWLYRKNVRSIDAMTNLSLASRDRLASDYVMGLEDPAKVSASTDGTRKYLYRAGSAGNPGGSRFVEAAYIPEANRSTLCLSTQIGCKMGCLFCMTGKQGFQGQLSATEILNQFASLPEKNSVTNLVYMGMGEPLDNLDPVMQSLEILSADWGYGMSPARITVSTIGIVPGIQRFLSESGAHLAVSMHSPFEEERRRLMPVQHVYPLREVLELLRSSDMPRQRRVSFEYIVFGGLNHSPAHVKEIARLLAGIRSRVNLIRFHTIPDTPLLPATDEQMIIFQNRLKAKGILTTIRKSRGEDILAACGLLSTRELTSPAVAADY
ncbi:MAG TPA: 23S rRNA (adenine(2503)-C(2))-methyltransferase RlmN [Spirochaetia bacterium]|nr:23S rRNA (adenine(2503)-C(2))-methyltransferase RlmN [Spirochaetia bacterium]